MNSQQKFEQDQNNISTSLLKDCLKWMNSIDDDLEIEVNDLMTMLGKHFKIDTKTSKELFQLGFDFAESATDLLNVISKSEKETYLQKEQNTSEYFKIYYNDAFLQAEMEKALIKETEEIKYELKKEKAKGKLLEAQFRNSEIASSNLNIHLSFLECYSNRPDSNSFENYFDKEHKNFNRHLQELLDLPF